MIVVCLEPEAVDNGSMNGGALVVHRAMVVMWRWREMPVLV